MIISDIAASLLLTCNFSSRIRGSVFNCAEIGRFIYGGVSSLRIRKSQKICGDCGRIFFCFICLCGDMLWNLDSF